MGYPPPLSLMAVPIFAIYVLDRFREHALASKNPFLIPLILFDQTLFDHSLIQSSMNQARLSPPHASLDVHVSAGIGLPP